MGGEISRKKTYEILPPELYYDAITKGNKIQRFWQDHKFKSVLKKCAPRQTDYFMDIGCGPGVLLLKIPKDSGFAMGMDISKNQVKFTNKLLKNNQNIVGVCQNIPLKRNSLDCIFLVEVLEHLSPDEAIKALQSIQATLKSGGDLVLTTPNYRSLWPIVEYFWSKINPVNYNEQHINKQTIDRIQKELINLGFKNIEIETIYILSPFFATLSSRFAELLVKIEKKVLPKFGSLIIVKAEK
jgi:SAM-dependent methyltransferase